VNKTTGGTAGNARRYRGKTKSGQTFAVVELLDPSDSQYFRVIMRQKGWKELTPPVKGNTFRSKPPTEEWMKKVANIDPDWWYISGHFARTKAVDENFYLNAGFFNKPYYEKVFHQAYDSSSGSHLVKKGSEAYVQIDPPSWHIRMEYQRTRDELKHGNFFEEYGKGSYPNAKVVLAVGCNTLLFPRVRRYLSRLFPKAIVLGHVNKNPADATPIIRNFLGRYFSTPHRRGIDIISSWLSYYDRSDVKNSIMRRGYALATSDGGFVTGIDVKGEYVKPPPHGAAVTSRALHNFSKDHRADDATIMRSRFKSVSKIGGGRLVDVLFVGTLSEVFIHEGMYHGDKDISYFDLSNPFSDTDSFPYLSPRNLARNRGY
jgi:hypothetical protein